MDDIENDFKRGYALHSICDADGWRTFYVHWRKQKKMNRKQLKMTKDLYALARRNTFGV